MNWSEGVMVIFLFLMISLFNGSEYLLSTLIKLEGLALLTFLTILSSVFWPSLAMFSIIFLIVVVCEGALGLVMLILLARAKGSNFFKGSEGSLW